MDVHPNKHETIHFTARDGYPLCGTLFHPQDPPHAGILITAGTGFRQSYYAAIARRAASLGYLVFTFDARGIGQSAPNDLSDFTMHYTDWGWHDTPAALEVLAAALPNQAIYHIAHSVGGHFLGLWDNHDRIAAHIFLCVGSGYWADHKWPSKLLEYYFWNVYGPWSLKRHGYIQTSGGWRGAPLPRGVYEVWRRWCQNSRYFLDELERDPVFYNHHYRAIGAPITSFIYTDDPIATPKTGQVMLDLYPNAEKEMRVRSPQDYCLKTIGHNGPFRDHHQAAQDEIFDILKTGNN